MEEDRMMILKMLQEGKIDADQAARLLEALEAGKTEEKKENVKEERTGRWFRVRVSDVITGNQKTNIRIPIGLMNAGFRIGAQFSPEVSALKSDDIMNAIKSGKTGLIIDVIDDDDNEHVEIFIE
ncbi:MAG TPA: hypothetical protein DCK95_05320 [Anaerolineaceae bacterium]|uniref:YvlB/LiaX N-terminal domain-containing protein n=1 Tax=Anaerolinea thermophila TaxID=167964 RepID=A0A101FYU5_9CHLR|nr:MAG: hypothetical protein XD73_0278 [Anaerolinea thermophila]HAF61726.1 hypothetical protein [Anaerolineaceae bacterium]